MTDEKDRTCVFVDPPGFGVFNPQWEHSVQSWKAVQNESVKEEEQK